MRQIPSENVRRWTTLAGARVPQSAATWCPHCQAQAVFDLKQAAYDAVRKTVAFTANCPSCAVDVHFWLVELRRQASDPPASLFVHPPGTPVRTAKAFGDAVPEPLRRSYVSAVGALVSRNYVATAVCSRRTLEGIFKYALPPEDQALNLARAIDRVKETRDLAAPLTTLSHAIRQGGNLGAHFDDENEPTADLAQQMVDLLEYLIEYLYTLPGEITALEAALSTTNPAR